MALDPSGPSGWKFKLFSELGGWYSATQRQTAVTAYLISMWQFLLFAQHNIIQVYLYRYIFL